MHRFFGETGGLGRGGVGCSLMGPGQCPGESQAAKLPEAPST